MMRKPVSTPTSRALLTLCAAFCGLAPIFACSAADDGLAEALREGFPDQAAAVLEREALVPTSLGFTRARSSAGSWSGLDISLPLRADEPIVFRQPGVFEARVFEEGASGDAAQVEGAVAYKRAGGTSFWTVAAGGIEEWLHLEEGLVRRGVAVTRWHVEGATLRQAGEVVEVLDSGDRAQLFVTAPEAFGKGGRAIDARLTVEGDAIALYVDVDGEAVLVDPIWSTTGSMAAARNQFAMTLLGDGRVLAAGGRVSNSANPETATAEIFDPLGGTWTSAGNISAAREWASAVWIPSVARAMVVGGQSGVGYFATADLYDPANDTWSLAAPMSTPRSTQTAALLFDGRVLVAGGNSTTGEIYDPATNAWTVTNAMSSSRLWASMTLLSSGKVLVAGGLSGVSTADIFDPSTNAWSPVGSMTTSRLFHTLSPLPNGGALAAGGRAVFAGAALASAEVFDPSTNVWSAIAPMALARAQHTATPLADGRVLVTGSSGTATTEIFDPATSTWGSGPPMSTVRAGHGALALASGAVLVAGGATTVATLSSAEIFTNATGGACTSGAECDTGFCSDGVCCDAACNAGACDACAVAAGASADGTCTLLTGPVCNDGDLCTQADTCQSGACVGTAVVCTALDQCHGVGTCNGFNGVCSNPFLPNGTACNDGAACSPSDSCQFGLCIPLGQPDGTCNGTTCMSILETHAAGYSAPIVEDMLIVNDSANPSAASTNYGSLALLPVGHVGTAYQRATFFFDFVAANVPTTATFTSATLSLTMFHSYGQNAFDVYACSSPWKEHVSTWAGVAAGGPNQGLGALSATVPTFGMPLGSTLTAMIPTPVVQPWLQSPTQNHGFIINHPLPGYTEIVSREGLLVRRPKLQLCYPEASCNDGVQNNDELGVDCDGSCAPCGP